MTSKGLITFLLCLCKSSACGPPPLLEGLSNLTPSSHAPSVISSNDEGGFNEPSPDIKAKLKPAYTYETTTITAATPVTPPITTNSTQNLCSDKVYDKTIDSHFNEEDYNAHQHSLHYVDFGYRLNPDGSESKLCFSEEQYDTAENVNVNLNNGQNVNLVNHQLSPAPRFDKRTVHYPVADSVVYAAIKSEPVSLSPPVKPKFNCDTKNYGIDDYSNVEDNLSDIDEKFEQIYSSATKDLDMLNDDDVHLPDGDSSFNLDNVEFADASDKEDLPDAMTAYEADRLLSSR